MKICIECELQRRGNEPPKEITSPKALKVKEDRIISGIRAVKRFLRISQENELYVCEEHIGAQRKKREEFEKSMLMFGILAAVAVLLLIAMVLLSGRFDPVYLAYSILVGVFIIAFAVLFRYAPAVEGPAGAQAPLPGPGVPQNAGNLRQQPHGAPKPETGNGKQETSGQGGGNSRKKKR